MSIISSTFGPTILSGKDAARFLEQIECGSVDKNKVQESLARGRDILAKIQLKTENKHGS